MAAQYNALNFGQGFPNFDPIAHVPKSLSSAPLQSNWNNQYTRDFGKKELVETLAKFYAPLFGHEIDPLSNILVTNGAYAALYISTQVFINPGDEVIIIEPFFDCYAPMVRLAGGKPIFIQLKPFGPIGTTKNWKLDLVRLQERIDKKEISPKIFFLNNPNNPLGKVFSKNELEDIAQFITKNDMLCISDEVYEHLVYEPLEHIRIGSLPSMQERTITIGSAGKTWSVTGWKTGWAIGPESLVIPMQTFYVNTLGSGTTPIQAALTDCFNYEMSLRDDMHPTKNPDSYFRSLAEKELRPKREKLAKLLARLGLEAVMPDGGYFMMADATKFREKIAESDLGGPHDAPWDRKFMYWMAREKQLIIIPVSAFYDTKNRHENANFIRFCFAKNEETISALDKIA